MRSLLTSTVILSALLLSMPLMGQQTAAHLTATTRSNLQAQGKHIFDQEMARERSGDCKTADSTADFNHCFGEQRDITADDLKRFEQVIRKLILNSPKDDVCVGVALTREQKLKEFDRVEQVWRQYTSIATKAALDQFDCGSGASSFALQSEIALIRNHMRELDLIYGGYLHL